MAPKPVSLTLSGEGAVMTEIANGKSMFYSLDKVFACKALSANSRPLVSFIAFNDQAKEFVCNCFECDNEVCMVLLLLCF